MTDLDKDVIRIQDDVKELQRQAATVDVLVDRLDTTLDKLTEVSSQVQQMLLVHEHRFDEAERQHETVSRQLDNRSESIDRELNNVHKRISSLETKLDDRLKKIEMWQWVIVGGASVVGFLISRFISLDFLK
jgi:predicted RNase H-like nuclease (RuvC/YqgF family)